MKAGIRIGTMGLLAAGLLVGQMAFAEGQGKRQAKGKGLGNQVRDTSENATPGKGARARRQERQEARKQHKKQLQKRMQQNRQARRQLMKAVAAEEDAQKALGMVREHIVSQQAERAAFHAGEMEKRLEMVGERLGKSNMDEAKREEILKRMVKNMEASKAEAKARQAELLASLDALKGKEDLTKKDILGALRDSRPDMKRDRDGKRGKERSEEMKRKRDGSGDGTGELKRKRDGSGDGTGEIKRKREKKSRKAVDA